METQDVQRKKHCDHCSLAFGLSERRFEFEGKVVHREPCLMVLQACLARLQERFVVRMTEGMTLH